VRDTDDEIYGDMASRNQSVKSALRDSWERLGCRGLICCFFMMMVCPLFAQTQRRALFNGKDLDGWQQVGPGLFAVKDGMMKTEGGMGMLWYTREKIAQATLRVVFRLTGKESDSGVFIRIPEKPTEPWMPINRGYEVEIGDWPDDYSCTGVLYTFTKALARPIKPVGEWNTMEITIDGPHTVVLLNGVRVTDFTEGQAVPAKTPGSHDPDRGPRPKSGFIGLQNHPGSEVDFREVSLMPLRGRSE
jgi:3-keto-disaccharide hydrolase